MNLNETITVLEALASGCSPTTGAVVAQESVLNEREVIRALQVAIEQLKNEPAKKTQEINIDAAEIRAVIHLLSEQQQTATQNKLADFFLAGRTFKNEAIASHELYGKYKGLYAKGQLMDFFTAWLSHNEYSKYGKRSDKKDKPWEDIDFFQQVLFNHYSEAGIAQLETNVNDLGILKTEHLAAYLQKARLKYPRSHETWNKVEDQLLLTALQQTNDLSLLSACFQRGPNAIEARGKRLLYEQQNNLSNL